MSKVVKDLVVSLGKYVNKDGIERNNFQSVGIIIINDDGSMSLKLEKTFNPAGITGDCWIRVMDKRPNNSNSEPVVTETTPF